MFFVETRERLTYGLLNFFEKYGKIMQFCNFLKKLFLQYIFSYPVLFSFISINSSCEHRKKIWGVKGMAGLVGVPGRSHDGGEFAKILGKFS